VVFPFSALQVDLTVYTSFNQNVTFRFAEGDTRLIPLPGFGIELLLNWNYAENGKPPYVSGFFR